MGVTKRVCFTAVLGSMRGEREINNFDMNLEMAQGHILSNGYFLITVQETRFRCLSKGHTIKPV